MRANWTDEELAALREHYHNHGPSWDGWSELLPGRSKDANKWRYQMQGLGGGIVSDPVKAPTHYDGAHGVACMDAMRNMLDRDLSGAVVPMSAAAVYWWGCALKYVWRAPFKSGAQDIAKAIRCLEYMAGEVTAGDD